MNERADATGEGGRRAQGVGRTRGKGRREGEKSTGSRRARRKKKKG